MSGPRTFARDRARNEITPTVISFPTRPINEFTAKHQREAKDATYLGRIREAVDLTRAAMTEDGATAGIVSMISHGILGLPLALQGDAAMCSALLDANGTPGEYGQMMPESEAAQIFADGIVMNFGLGQLIEVCWQCRSDCLSVSGECCDCGAFMLDRPAGMHSVPMLRHWDPRWLRQDPYSREWWLITRTKEVRISPGDGEWFLFQPYPKVDAWRYGPWLYLTLAFIFGRDAVYDRQRHSEVLAPVRVARAMKPTTPVARAKLQAELDRMQRDNRMVLPEQWIYEVVSSSGNILDVYSAIIEWARQQVEIGLTGNIVGVEGNKGFTSADVYQRVTDSKRRFYAKAWASAVRSQVLSWWGVDNFGSRNVPQPSYNVESPEDAAARWDSIQKAGLALQTLKQGLDAHGLTAEQDWTRETMQRAGIRTVVKPMGASPVAKLDFAPTDLSAFVTVDEARASQGLGPDPQGNGTKYVVEVKNTKTVLDGSGASSNSPAHQEADSGAPMLAAEVEPSDDMAERLAQKMSELKLSRCEHGSLNRCRLCGVERVRDVSINADGEPSWAIAWRPINRKPIVIPHQVAT